MATAECNENATIVMDGCEARMIDGISARISYAHAEDAPVSDNEIRSYIERGTLQHPNSVVTALTLEVDGDDVGIRYVLAPVPFDRIRRITGYLVGTMDRWNDAKTSEERDRVKHGVSQENRAFSCSNGC